MEGQTDTTGSLSSIEKVLLGGNLAHDVISLEIDSEKFELSLQSCCPDHIIRRFSFSNPVIEYEELMLIDGEELEFPVPLIGADSMVTKDHSRHRFCINFSDFEIAFTSEWPLFKEDRY